MDPIYLAKIHGSLCSLHNELSDQIVAMPHTDALYRQANTTADAIYAAAQQVYKLLRYAQAPSEG